MPTPPSKCSLIKLKTHRTLQRQRGNLIVTTNCSQLRTTLYTPRAYSSTTARHGTASQQTKKQWTTSKQPSNRPNVNYATNNEQPSKPGSKPTVSGANQLTTTTAHCRKPQRHWQTSPQPPHRTVKRSKT